MNPITGLAPSQPMSVEGFHACTATRPPGERWQLIDGVAFVNPSPIDRHQLIVANSCGRDDTLDLPALGTGLRLADIYGRTPLAEDGPSEPAIRRGRRRPATKRRT